MNSGKLKLLSMLAILMWSVSVHCQAVDTANVVKTLGDGSLIVEYQGRKFRAVTDDQLKAIDKQGLELAATRAELAEADGQIAELRHVVETTALKVTIAEQQRDQAKSDFQHALSFIEQQKTLLEKESQLRKDSQQFIPHSSGNGFAAKFFNFLDRPAVQTVFKVGLPLFQATRSATGCK